jgi:hypothetical protein
MGWLELRAAEGRNISHGHLDEVKEILKKLGDDPFGNKAFAVVVATALCRRVGQLSIDASTQRGGYSAGITHLLE